MCLVDLDRHSSCKVKKLNATGELKHRMMSFGIISGKELELLNHTIGKSTIELKVGNMRLALRKKEAELIEVDV